MSFNTRIADYTARTQQAVQAITTAIMNGEEFHAVEIDHEDGPFTRFIPLPSRQTSGTETQKMSYAKMKARVLVENHYGIKY